METTDFAHLHVHSDASLRDGLGTVPRLVGRAKDLGFGSLALTDHGTLANSISFIIECNRAGIKPVIGLEGYIEVDGIIGHITLLADGNKGFNSLLNLNNIAHYSTLSQPAFTLKQLISHQEGLVCLTGCISSPMQQMSLSDSLKVGAHLKRAFGSRLFAELMFVGAELAPKRGMLLSERLGLQTVITNDVHFPFERDGEIHGILTSMKSGFEYDSKQLYLKAPEDLRKAAVAYGLSDEQAIRSLLRAGNIAKKIKTPKLAHEPHLPKVGATRSSIVDLYVPERRELLGSFEDENEYFDRHDYEMEVIEDLGYLDYFAILHDIIKRGEELGVQKGSARGSGAGCLILYLMGITDIDPIRFGLQFERFLNPLRKGFPDVDIDFESERRDLILDYAAEKYNAIPIATYSRYSHKSLVRDLGRYFKAEKGLISQASEGGESSEAFQKMVEEIPQFEQCYNSFKGQIRHKGKHAGGVVITDQDIPIERIAKDFHAAAWTEGKNSELSFAGLVKFDLLGLSALSALREMKEKTGKELATFPEPGDPVFKLFQDGDLSGVFQFSGSDGIRKLTMKLQPDSFMELVAINALFRPGAIDAGALENYPKWKKEPREVPEYFADVLAETHGSIVYQEQFMEIYRRTVSGTLAEADQARRTITKANPDSIDWREKFSALQEEFVDGAREHGLSLKESKSLWKELSTHTRYSFNKSHAVSYTLISWQTAFFKYYFPAVFYAAMLNSDPANEQTYILDALANGLKVSPPDVNESGIFWESNKKDTIFMPLSTIKFLGNIGAQAIVSRRGERGFSNLPDFMEKVPKKLVRARAREGLLMLGSFGKIPVGSLLEEQMELLELKTDPKELKKLSRAKSTFRYLGFVLPDKKLLEKFRKHEEMGFEVGTISSRDIRNKGKGFYAVYKLSPQGAFWSSDVLDLEKGEMIAVRIGKKGRALEIRSIT